MKHIVLTVIAIVAAATIFILYPFQPTKTMNKQIEIEGSKTETGDHH